MVDVVIVQEDEREPSGGPGHIFILESSPPVMRTLFCVKKLSYIFKVDADTKYGH